jgi:glycosyltransferase involved in cell wall biosynthesis
LTDSIESISVCVPTYNRSDQVRQLLGNLAEQVCLPDEILLVDASPDDLTGQVAKEFAERLPGLRHEVWEKGLTRQRNRAIELATGDVLLFLDDDIILEADFIQNLRRLMLEDEKHEITGLTGLLLNEKPQVPGPGWHLKRRLGIVETDEKGKLLACGETTPLPRPLSSALLPTGHLPGCLHAWRKEVIRKYRFSLFFQDYGLGEDKYFSCCASKNHALFVSSELKATHLHVAGNRPNYFRWGFFNVFNHFFIMRECSDGDWKRLRFFAFHGIDACNDLLTWPLRKNSKRTLVYGLGRLCGLVRCLTLPPRMAPDDPAWMNGHERQAARD